ncbi:Nif11-like leader peptide family natural product precursor [Chrysosporum bergii ANA360D]|uniref:Nif11-like leader peptide family natural product n=1 Tax=Chrysosporum bergii ANA360D TaxID=617107 RepID=A0AA43GPX7_9CYAN|nr:Nif11-like leader peptide family natural product precursor [Chrysosporum bergii]MDH6059335.1 Nif11-like leader peptide family natural product precursor [Chrysosporum bergii ANA360D]
MTNQAVSLFLEKVAADEQLQSQLAKVLESAEDAEGADREAAVGLAKEHGFDFTSEELWAEIKRLKFNVEDEELEADLQRRLKLVELVVEGKELEAISGGIKFSF